MDRGGFLKAHILVGISLPASEIRHMQKINSILDVLVKLSIIFCNVVPPAMRMIEQVGS